MSNILSVDERGLPVMAWREDAGLRQRARECRIQRDDKGEYFFAMSRDEDDADTAAIPLLILGAGLGFVACIFISWPLRELLPPGLVMFIGMIAGGVLGAKFGGRLMRRLGIGVKSELTLVPWAELRGFFVTTDQVQLGTPLRDDKGNPIKPVQFIVADFANAAGAATVAEMDVSVEAIGFHHQLLTREFVEKRAAHLARLAREDREARDALIGDRRKVV